MPNTPMSAVPTITPPIYNWEYYQGQLQHPGAQIRPPPVLDHTSPTIVYDLTRPSPECALPYTPSLRAPMVCHKDSIALNTQSGALRRNPSKALSSQGGSDGTLTVVFDDVKGGPSLSNGVQKRRKRFSRATQRKLQNRLPPIREHFRSFFPMAGSEPVKNSSSTRRAVAVPRPGAVHLSSYKVVTGGETRSPPRSEFRKGNGGICPLP
ncbi:hypothetical protein BGZ63DRAFT_95760 [Mariannaea sp. PMI_226]|nr:hypothetical protein BGZ63DRAFT_95760 [Mariannaea sp. PMI_226]